jgi:hypothetical protein
MNSPIPLDWRASPNFSSRNGQRVRLIVVHDCEGSYLGSVSWFALAAAQVSAHIVLSEDGARATQMVAFGNKAWHVCAFNGFSEGIEAAGYAAKGLGAAEWRALAKLTAWRLKANGIPCQVATAANNWTGFCQHADLGAAGGGHHDITHDPAVWAAFVRMVGEEYPAASADGQGTTNLPASPPISPPASWVSPSAAPRHDLVEGSLAWVQARLNALGFAHPSLVVDGMDGPNTEHAVISFQIGKKLTVDGVVGPETLKALEAA